ncbi:hypothetical protein THTE_0888 [Thermogutta terrifontis]|uniref:Uncharacterized protein n=1 Tax=Thermogutta terrifontis TaxID=1331910 RepID=A0A286RBZ8_9BACT|nr:hypothetical protein THTE_0888 [Thermogutta terrifontis]
MKRGPANGIPVGWIDELPWREIKCGHGHQILVGAIYELPLPRGPISNT